MLSKLLTCPRRFPSFAMIMIELYTGERLFKGLEVHQLMYLARSSKNPKNPGSPPCATPSCVCIYSPHVLLFVSSSVPCSAGSHSVSCTLACGDLAQRVQRLEDFHGRRVTSTW